VTTQLQLTNISYHITSGRWRRRNREGETQEERKGKDVNGGEKKHLIPFRKLQITTVTTDPMTHKITYQTSRNFQTFAREVR
jgi:hypothetical protein